VNSKPGRTALSVLIVLVITPVAASLGQTTYYVNGKCGNDAWTGTNQTCLAPNGPKRTIQAGINASVTGDTVIVADGTYAGFGNVNLDFAGRDITLHSASGDPNLCVIDCEIGGRGFHFHNSESPAAVVEGFTITNAQGGDYGGAILCEDFSSPTIRTCIITRSDAAFGGGICCIYESRPVIVNCIIAENFGAGIACAYGGAPTIIGCTIMRHGTGIFHAGPASTITNCTIYANIQGLSCNGNEVTIKNTILWGNHDYEISIGQFSTASVSYCDVEDGRAGIVVYGTLNWGEGNIELNPVFEDAACRLSGDSPCIDAGDNTAVPAGILSDLDGNSRFVDDPCTPNTGSGTPPIVDMGAYEFQLSCRADLDDSGIVDLSDLGILLAGFGCTGGSCPGDIDCDDDTDLGDLGILLANFGTTCP
jgi:hypothetical protein